MPDRQMSLNKQELEWFLPTHYRLSIGLTVFIAICLGMSSNILILYSIFTTQIVVMQWLTRVMVVMLVGLPIISAYITARWTHHHIEDGTHEVVLETNFSEQQIAEGYNVAARYRMRGILIISLFLLPSCALIMSWHILLLDRTMQMLVSGAAHYEYEGDPFKMVPPNHFIVLNVGGFATLLLLFTALVFSLWLMNLLGIALGVETGIQEQPHASSRAMLHGIGYAILFYVVFMPTVLVVTGYFLFGTVKPNDPSDATRLIVLIIILIIFLLWPCIWQIREIIRNTKDKISRAYPSDLISNIP